MKAQNYMLWLVVGNRISIWARDQNKTGIKKNLSHAHRERKQQLPNTN